MPRRLSLLIAAVGLCATVIIAAWWHASSDRSDTRIPLAQSPTVWPGDGPGASVDPTVALATIHELRAEFGSVLANSELEIFDSQPVLDGDHNVKSRESFDDFLRAAAGVDAEATMQQSREPDEPGEPHESGEPDELDAATKTIENPSSTAPSQLARSMGLTANLLTEHARHARVHGDMAKAQRFLGIASLLRAEVEALTPSAE